ncbi:MAG: hypothetical protein OEY28_00410 [Nitrospira sp.]|nr:hypothetical protein [Nitrospira sp.]
MKDSRIEDNCASTLDITFGDFLVFSDWMSQTHKILALAEPLPPAPNLASAKVRGWVQAIHQLEARARQAERQALLTETNALARESQLGQLLARLYMHMAALYEHLGQPQKAAEFRHKSRTFQYN